MKKIEEIRAVRKAHRLDENSLKNYLLHHLDGFQGDLTLRQFGYGQSNPTYLLSTDDRTFVLRKKPPGKLLPSAHAVDREYRIIKTLEETDVPVPRTYLLCEDESIIGTPFYVMDYVPGRVFRDPTIPEAQSAAERAAIYDAMNDTLAKIHSVDWKARGLEDFGKPGNYMARQVSRWARQYEASQTNDIESMNNLIQWLKDHIPADDSTTIVHGDFRLENMIIHPQEPRVVAVLDWELSTLGHPLADLAYNCMGYHMPDLGDKQFSLSNKDLQSWGIPNEKQYVAAYCRRTRRADIPGWNFYMAFGIFRLAAIVQGVYKRGLDGIASAANAREYGDMVRFLSDTAWQLVEKGKKPA